MSETDLMTGYRYDRILVGSTRVLSPQFSGSWVYMTGGQFEMLRNVAGYLGRRTTFVDEYHDAYYVMPNDTDWDTISSIVADLEEKIMGTGNTPWGYREQLIQGIEADVGEDGTFNFDTSVVPVGEVWVVQHMDIVNFTAIRAKAKLQIMNGTFVALLEEVPSPVATVRTKWDGAITLKHGDWARCQMTQCITDDEVTAAVWGYIMDVPD